MFSQRKVSLTGALAAAIVLLVAASAHGALPRTYQVQRVDSPTTGNNINFGDTMVGVGDIDGDEKVDMLIGADKHGRRQGQAVILSGATGAVIRQLQIPPADVDPGGSGERPTGLGAAVTRIGIRSSSPPFSDIGSCPGGPNATTHICTDNPIGAPDGVPDLVVTASGEDVGTAKDVGAAYLFDGATGAVLKTLRMPAADRAQQEGFAWDSRYGRTVLVPSALPACQGNGGLDTCPGTMPAAVRIGDLDGGGSSSCSSAANCPDILMGVTDYTESTGGAGTANPESDCFTAPGGGECDDAGRVYVYRGEQIAGSDPNAVLEAPATTITNRAAVPDAPNTPPTSDAELSALVIPLGDVGSCTSSPGPGHACPTTGATDGKPDYVLTSPATDLFGMPDVGLAMTIDGATASVLRTYQHPETQPGAAFGLTQNGVVQPAFGDLGQDTTPDFYVPALGQNVNGTAVGRGYVENGSLSSRLRFTAFSQLNDPTPNSSGQFGASAAGVGNLAGDGRNELLIGGTGPHAPGTNDKVLNDVHFFDPITEQAMQTVADPDQQGGDSFGTGVVPLGDLNSDGFLDFAVGAGLWTGSVSNTTAQGRVFIFRSDNSPAPPPPPAPGPEVGPQGPEGPRGPAGPAIALAGRTLELAASADSVRAGRRFSLRGTLEAFANPQTCERGQTVSLQRRARRSSRYRTFATMRTNSRGDFARRLSPTRTYVYRARVGETSQCLGAVSNREMVSVRAVRRARR